MKGKIIQTKYHILQTLSRDAFSETFLAKSNNRFSRDRYIIKKFRPILGNPQGVNVKRLFYQEASVLKRLSGNNRQIPRLYEYFMDGEDFYLVREWIEGLTLEQKVQQQGNLSETEVEKILKSILSCLKYIHDHGIVYRQLAPSSIILRQNYWKDKLGEDYLPVPIYFGGVKELETKISHFNQCSLVLANQQEYVSPEQEQGRSLYASDLYSLGLTAIYLLTGKTPAELPCDPHTNRLLWHQERPGLKIHLVRVIDRAICSNFQERFTTAEEMLKALHSHPVSLSMPVADNHSRSPRPPESRLLGVLSFLSIGVLGIVFLLLNIDFSPSADQELVKSARAYKAQSLSKSFESLSAEELTVRRQFINVSTIPASPVGKPRQQITSLLGKPTMESRGYWQNSRALLYQDVVPNKITLGYLTDVDTTDVRQAEITFSSSVDLTTIQQAAKQLLQEQYSAEVEKYINQIYFRTSNLQEFNVNNLKGVVQRNPQEHIYLGIWEQEFH